MVLENLLQLFLSPVLLSATVVLDGEMKGKTLSQNKKDYTREMMADEKMAALI